MATRTLDFAHPHVLRNQKEYKAAVAEIDVLLDADPRAGTRAYDRLEFLSVLVEAYEDEHDRFDDSGTPQEVVDFMLSQHGMTRGELDPLLGGKARVSQFFSGKRRLSIKQIDALREKLGIPADLLLEVVPRQAARGGHSSRTSAAPKTRERSRTLRESTRRGVTVRAIKRERGGRTSIHEKLAATAGSLRRDQPVAALRRRPTT